MNYEAPRVEIIEVEVEKGYAASVSDYPNGGDPFKFKGGRTMKTIFRLFCGWMAIALAACTGDELSRETDKQQPDGTRVVSVKAYTPGEQPESKLAFEEKDDGSLGVSWASGDAFTAVVGDEKVTFTYDTEKNQFTATLPEGVTLADGVKAYYPAYTGEYTTDLSAQTGKPDSKVTYMEERTANPATRSGSATPPPS